MPEYLAPGVYVEEVDTGIKTIEGVSTSVAGMVGTTLRGPLRGLPRLVTSFAEFERLFGGYFPAGSGFAGHRALPYAVSGFFTNGGRQLYVARVAHDVTAARKATKGGIVTRLAQNVVSGATSLKPVSLLGIEKGKTIKLRIDGPPQVITPDLLVNKVNANGDVDFTPAVTANFDASDTIVLVEPSIARTASVILDAAEPGSWGRDIRVAATPQAAATAQMDSTSTADKTVTLKVQAPSFYPGGWIEVDRGESKVLRKIKAVDHSGPKSVLTIDGYTATDFTPDPSGSTDPITVTLWELKLDLSYGTVVESYSGLTLENVPGKYILDRLQNSALVRIDITGVPTDPLSFPAADDGLSFQLDDAGFGTDGSAPQPTDYIGGGDPGDRFGLKALEDIDRISIIAVPGNVDIPVQAALIGQCETLKDRFAILDPAGTTVNHVVAQRQQFDTKYAAIYFPNLRVFDPVSGSEITVPPSGHMAGLYARVDIERGVHKAPANEVVRGITNFALTVNKETHDLLNPGPTNINVFRDFRADGRGLRIWGARVMTSDTAWKYINVRRLFLFIEESIDEGTQWVVFEPNDEPLWARVRQSITAFLTRVWRDGALQGATPEEAFFVKCDRTTMTQDDLDNGKLICLVGVAPVKPAEFVIIRISQFTASAEA